MPILQPETPAWLTTDLSAHYQAVRQRSLEIAAPLSEADMCIQSMADASPIRWHLAHTTWFFETFILKPYLKSYKVLDESYNYLFNSYYNGIGEQFPRPLRGTQTRPTITDIYRYRDHVDECIGPLLLAADESLAFLITLGLNHEQQHQELMLTDIKHAFLQNPAFPVYSRSSEQPAAGSGAVPLSWLPIPEGVYEVGHAGGSFSYDNEKPRHKQYVHSTTIGSRLVTNGEFLEFVESAGYEEPGLWLADGWDWVQRERHKYPAYWRKRGNAWFEFTLNGLQPLALQAPVTHISFYEANAFASWCGRRLPTEFEWEVAASLYGAERPDGNFYESGRLRPYPREGEQHYQFWGDVWEWTASAYSAYPGFQPFSGNAGEYNGKFMCNQYVLRGGSCVTPASHIRKSYRNFFYPHQHWQFTGLRLVQDQ